MDPKLRKHAHKIAKRAWKGAKTSATLVVIAPYLPMVLFLVLCDWVQRELGEFPAKEDVKCMSD